MPTNLVRFTVIFAASKTRLCIIVKAHNRGRGPTACAAAAFRLEPAVDRGIP